MGLLRYCARHHPQLRRHLSVQASATSHEAIGFYAREFGVQRVVLPRVLSLQQVRQVIAHSPVEVEVFGFGSLCIMVEGTLLSVVVCHRRVAQHLRCVLAGESSTLGGGRRHAPLAPQRRAYRRVRARRAGRLSDAVQRAFCCTGTYECRAVQGRRNAARGQEPGAAGRRMRRSGGCGRRDRLRARRADQPECARHPAGTHARRGRQPSRSRAGSAARPTSRR